MNDYKTFAYLFFGSAILCALLLFCGFLIQENRRLDNEVRMYQEKNESLKQKFHVYPYNTPVINTNTNTSPRLLLKSHIF